MTSVSLCYIVYSACILENDFRLIRISPWAITLPELSVSIRAAVDATRLTSTIFEPFLPYPLRVASNS